MATFRQLLREAVRGYFSIRISITNNEKRYSLLELFLGILYNIPHFYFFGGMYCISRPNDTNLTSQASVLENYLKFGSSNHNNLKK